MLKLLFKHLCQVLVYPLQELGLCPLRLPILSLNSHAKKVFPFIELKFLCLFYLLILAFLP